MLGIFSDAAHIYLILEFARYAKHYTTLQCYVLHCCLRHIQCNAYAMCTCSAQCIRTNCKCTVYASASLSGLHLNMTQYAVFCWKDCVHNLIVIMCCTNIADCNIIFYCLPHSGGSVASALRATHGKGLPDILAAK
jgi:hypothetical protein